jgi:molecular chaperone DnaK
MDELEATLEDEDADKEEIEDASKALSEELQEIGKQMYDGAAAQGGPEGGMGGGMGGEGGMGGGMGGDGAAAEGEDEEYVDADFEDVEEEDEEA